MGGSYLCDTSGLTQTSHHLYSVKLMVNDQALDGTIKDFLRDRIEKFI